MKNIKKNIMLKGENSMKIESLNKFKKWYKGICNRNTDWQEIDPETVPEEFTDVKEWLENHKLWLVCKSKVDSNKKRLFMAWDVNNYGKSISQVVQEEIDKRLMNNVEFSKRRSELEKEKADLEYKLKMVELEKASLQDEFKITEI